MLLKRSVSPDGRIDSLSVEFSCPVGAVTASDIKAQAATILALQGEIAQGFLKVNGNGKNGAPPRNGNDAPNAVAAQLLAVASMNGRWGRRLFLNVLVNGQVLKFFGSEKQLAGALADAGYPDVGNVLAEPQAEQLALCVLVKTKLPQIEWHTTDRTSDRLIEYLDKVGYIAGEIAASRFYKRPGKWCAWCDFLPLCLGDKRKARETLVKIQ